MREKLDEIWMKFEKIYDKLNGGILKENEKILR